MRHKILSSGVDPLFFISSPHGKMLKFVPALKLIDKNAFTDSRRRIISRITPNDKREYAADTSERLEYELATCPGSLHEIIHKDNLIQVYLDIDSPAHVFADELAANAFVLRVIGLVEGAQPFKGYKLPNRDAVILSAHKAGLKWSYHVRLQFRHPSSGRPIGVRGGPRAIKSWLKARLLPRLHEWERPLVDTAPYGQPTQSLRCVYASKSQEPGKRRPFVPASLRHRRMGVAEVIRRCWVRLNDTEAVPVELVGCGRPGAAGMRSVPLAVRQAVQARRALAGAGLMAVRRGQESQPQEELTEFERLYRSRCGKAF